METRSHRVSLVLPNFVALAIIAWLLALLLFFNVFQSLKISPFSTGRDAIMPILLYLVIGTIRESSPANKQEEEVSHVVTVALKTLTMLCSAKSFNKDSEKLSSQHVQVSLPSVIQTIIDNTNIVVRLLVHGLHVV